MSGFSSDEHGEFKNSMLSVFADDGTISNDDCKDLDTDDVLILPLRNMVLFPGNTIPINVGRTKSLKLLQSAQSFNRPIGVISQINPATEDPLLDDLFHMGTVGEVVKILEMHDQTTPVILHGKKRFILEDITSSKPFLRGKITLLDEIESSKEDEEFTALIKSLQIMITRIFDILDELPRDMVYAVKNIANPSVLGNYLCAGLPITLPQKQKLLELDTIKDRAFSLQKILAKDIQLLEIKEEMLNRTREDINQQQREHYLQAQIKTIQQELGNNPIGRAHLRRG